MIGNKEDTIDENIEYSNDFNSASQATHKIDTKIQNEDKKNPDSIKEPSNVENSEISEEYSEHFDDSNDASSQLVKSIKSLNKDNKSGKIISDQIQEAIGENEGESTPRINTQDDNKSRNVQKEVQASKSDSIINETPLDSDEQSKDEYVHRIPTGKSDEYIGKLIESASSNDLEVIEGSHQSVDWVIDVPVSQPEKDKLNTINEDSKDSKEEEKINDKNKDEVSEDYSIDDFDIDENNNSKRSNQDAETPRISEKSEDDDIMNDKEKVADLIAEEFFSAIDDLGLFDKMKTKILPERDFTEDDFKDKFPFVKPNEPKLEKKMQLHTQVEFFNGLADEIMKDRNCQEIINKILAPNNVDYLEEMRRLKVGQDDDEIDPGDQDNLISKKLFQSVNTRILRQQNGISKKKQKAIESHNHALYIAFNEVFTKMIPAGLKSNPFKWINRNHAFKYESMKSENSITQKDIAKILKRVKKRLKEYIAIPISEKEGLVQKPVNQEDQDSEANKKNEEKRKKKIMEENL